MEDEQVSGVSDTQHEPHAHARPRVIAGLLAVILVAAGFMVWFRWGDEIVARCTGDTACDTQGATPESPAAPDTSAFESL